LANAWFTVAVARLLEATSVGGCLFHYTRVPAYWGTTERIERALELRPNERLLDVGCGTGIWTSLARGFYVGLDTDLALLRYAARRATEARTALVKMSALDLGFVGQAFDRAVIINVIHHLDDLTVDRLLAQLKRVVRTRVVVADVAPEYANRVEAFFNRHDRGAHIRSTEALRNLLARHYTIEREEAFHNWLHTTSQVLFTLAPKNGAPTWT